MKNNLLEIACYTIESVVLAENSGADRIELCDNFYEGGITPSYGMVVKVLDVTKIPVNVIVRPRGGDFLYSDDEFEIIKQDVKMIKSLGANGIVVGFLKDDGEIDLERTKEIVDLAEDMEVTFHRAFDVCKNQFMALEQLTKTGIKRVLTSGGKNSALEGVSQIADLVRDFGNELVIMPGGNVRDDNIWEIKRITGANEFHSAAMTFVKSKMKFLPEEVKMGNDSFDEFSVVSVDTDMIKSMKNKIL